MDRSKKGSIDENLPVNPDDLAKKPEWKETTHPGERKSGKRTFANSETGEKIQYHKGDPCKPGHRGRDHYHRLVPNEIGEYDFVDGKGNIVIEHSELSHLYPPEWIWWY